MNELVKSDKAFKLVVLEEDNDTTIISSATSSETSKNSQILDQQESGDEIVSSQTSTTSTRSSNFVHSISNKRIAQGTEVGRKVDKKRKLDHQNGQLTKYSGGNTVSESTASTSASILQDKSSSSSLKGVFEKRSFEIIQNILINKNKPIDILNGKIVIDEEDIIIDNLLSATNF